MKKYLNFILMLMLGTSICHAQTMEWSTLEKPDSHFPFVKIAGQDADGYFVLKSTLPIFSYKVKSWLRKREYMAAYYSNDMKLVWQKPLVLERKEASLERVIFYKQHLAIIYTEANSEKKTTGFYQVLINNKGNYSAAPQLLFSVASDEKLQDGEMYIVNSRDQSKWAMVLPKVAGNGNLHTHIYVSADSASRGAVREIVLPISAKLFQTKELMLLNDGTVYITGRKTDPDNKDVQDVVFFTLAPNATEFTTNTIDLSSAIAFDVAYSYDYLNDRFAIAGFFGNKIDGGIAGVFYQYYDKEGKLLASSKTNLKASNINRAYNADKKRPNEIFNYALDKIILRSDGGCIVVAEEFFTTYSSQFDVFTQTYVNRTNYHYNNILLLSINPDGSIDWDKVINKSQMSVDDGGYFLSYSYMALKNTLLFIFNDFNGRKSRVVYQAVDAQARSTNNTLYSESDDVILVPKAGIQIDEHVIIIPGEKNSKQGFLKLTF